MYESTSQASPRFDANSVSGIDVGFNGALDLLRTWRDGRTPDPELTVSRWADSHRLLSPRGANAGRDLALARLAIDRAASTPPRSTPGRAGTAYRKVMPVKGIDGFDRTTPVAESRFEGTVGGRRTRSAGGRLWRVSVAVFKSELYARLRLDPPTDEQLAGRGDYPAGYVHLPKGLDAERVKQQRQEWQKMRARNEMLDCRVYARAAAWLLGVAHRLDEAAWQRLELAASRSRRTSKKSHAASHGH